MPLTENEIALLRGREPDLDYERTESAPNNEAKIGKFTLMFMIWNRIIGSGVFFSPKRVLVGTGCVGGALCLWALAGLITIAGCYIWNECAFGMPQDTVADETEARGIPKNAGEKNFVEFVFHDRGLEPKHVRTTCSFSVMFMLLYNLSANAIAFALQALTASGYYDPASGEVPSRGSVIGIAIGALSVVILAHTISRKGGLWINNAFALVKVGLLLLIICLGVAKASGSFGGSGQAARTFYIITEARTPRRNFPRYSVLAVLVAVILFMLVNISYLLVIDKSDVLLRPRNPNGWYLSPDLATLFFDTVFEDDHSKAARAMAAVIAICIFGNLWVMTFTAARVKQEIAKEGILPWSLFFATSYRTPYGFVQEWYAKFSGTSIRTELVERAPTAAFALHWITSVLLIAATSPISDPRNSYSILVYLFTYSIVLVLGGWVSAGLLWVKVRKDWKWKDRARYIPWLSPAHVILYLLATSFLAVAAFVPPSHDSPFYHSVTGLPWYVLPAIGITAPFWGIVWYIALRLYEMSRQRKLQVTRDPYYIQDEEDVDEWVQAAELVSHSWMYRSKIA